MATLHKLKKEDYDRLVDAERAISETLGWTAIGQGYLSKLFSQKNLIGVLATEKDEIVGFALGTDYRGVGRIRFVRSMPEINGLSEKIVSDLIKELKKNKEINIIETRIYKKDDPLENFYKKQDFVTSKAFDKEINIIRWKGKNVKTKKKAEPKKKDKKAGKKLDTSKGKKLKPAKLVTQPKNEENDVDAIVSEVLENN